MEEKMRKAIAAALTMGGVVAGGLMLGAAGLVVGAGVAKADVAFPRGYEGDHSGYSFALELNYHGANQTAFQAASLGNEVCTDHLLGWTRNQLLDRMESVYSVDTASTP
jgi:hypothetical protein